MATEIIQTSESVVIGEATGGEICVALTAAGKTYDFDIGAATRLLFMGLYGFVPGYTKVINAWRDSACVELVSSKRGKGVLALHDRSLSGEIWCHIDRVQLQVIAQKMIGKFHVGPVIIG